jgi:16S rRNA (uracil1498-N3)-methyltransferase
MDANLWPNRSKGVSVRFYSPQPPIDGQLTLAGDEAKHLSRVCRLGVGDVVEIFDGRGLALSMQVIAAKGDKVELAAQGPPLPDPATPFPLTLATAFPKGDRLDWLVEKATELGVERLIPLTTERSVVDPRSTKLDRLRRAIIEASKQCRRNRLMELSDPITWKRLVAAETEHQRFVADFDGPPPHAWPIVTARRPTMLAIGPEGGFAPDELSLADQYGWTRLNLGAHILRIETAAIAGAAALFTRASESLA